MPFLRKYAQDVGTTAKPLSEQGAAYSTPTNKADVLIGLLLCNKSNTDVAVDIYVTNVGVANFVPIVLGRNITVLAGASEEFCDGNKIVLLTGDQIQVKSTVTASVDAYASMMQDDN